MKCDMYFNQKGDLIMKPKYLFILSLLLICNSSILGNFNNDKKYSKEEITYEDKLANHTYFASKLDDTAPPGPPPNPQPPAPPPPPGPPMPQPPGPPNPGSPMPILNI